MRSKISRGLPLTSEENPSIQGVLEGISRLSKTIRNWSVSDAKYKVFLEKDVLFEIDNLKRFFLAQGYGDGLDDKDKDEKYKDLYDQFQELVLTYKSAGKKDLDN